MTEQRITVRGLKEFRKALRDAGPEFPPQLRAANKRLADRAAELARFNALSMGGSAVHFADKIRGYAAGATASVGLSSPSANAAFWGAKRRFGWYANTRYADSAGRQNPDWVGAGWQVAATGEGPYAINDALAAMDDEIQKFYGEAIDAISAEAFPD